MNKKLIEKYIKGTADKREAEQVLEWAAESDENEQTLLRLKLDRLFLGFPNSDASPHAMRSFRQQFRHHRSFVPIFSRVAAVLILPVMCFSLYQYLSYTNKSKPQTPTISMAADDPYSIIEYTVNPGVKGRVVLPDSSEVWLNSNSVLITPRLFGGDARVVELSGEAFFDVKSDIERPMYVRTNRDITVIVTGTKFNVSTYANDDFFNLHLVSGKVRLINEHNKAEFDVLPAQEVYVKDAEQKFKLKVKPDKYLSTSWKEGYLVFDATIMSEVIRKMERWYGVCIEASDPAILKEKFTAEFKSESLTQVLDYLKMSSNINYLIADEKVVLSY